MKKTTIGALVALVASALAIGVLAVTYDAIEGLPGDYTVAQSLDSLQDELDAFPQAYATTFDGSGCSTV